MDVLFPTHASEKEVRVRQEKEVHVGKRRIREREMLWTTYALKVKDRGRKTRMCGCGKVGKAMQSECMGVHFSLASFRFIIVGFFFYSSNCPSALSSTGAGVQRYNKREKKKTSSCLHFSSSSNHRALQYLT